MGSPVVHHDYNGNYTQTSVDSPVSPIVSSIVGSAPCAITTDKKQKNARPADPMAFSSILSNSTNEPAKLASHAEIALKESRKPSRSSNGHLQVDETAPRMSTRQASNRHSASGVERIVRARSNGDVEMTDSSIHLNIGGKGRSTTSDKENEVNMAAAKIDETELSDLEVPEFDNCKMKFIEKSRKRALEIEQLDAAKRKVCLDLALWPLQGLLWLTRMNSSVVA
jgi:chromatin-remodeling ATPase INO80